LLASPSSIKAFAYFLPLAPLLRYLAGDGYGFALDTLLGGGLRRRAGRAALDLLLLRGLDAETAFGQLVSQSGRINPVVL